MNNTSLAQLLTKIHEESRVFIPGCSAQPDALLRAWPRDLPTHFVSNFVSGINDFSLLPDTGKRGSHTLFFMPPKSHQAMESSLHYLPLTYHGIYQYLRNGPPLDVAFAQVTPPANTGECSFGPSVEFALTVNARRRVALVNPALPKGIHSAAINLDHFDDVVELESPLFELSMAPTDEISQTIARHVATLVDDGDCLQIGIGKLASAIMDALHGRQNLRFHSGILSGALRELVESGATCRDRSSLRCATLAGDADFYHWASNREDIEVTGVGQTHSPHKLAAVENLVAINSAIEVDLLGQVNSEAVGSRVVSGPGGLPDFAHAAHRSTGGRSIIALPSRSGEHSRIVPRLSAGTPITLPRHDVDLVVTEHGVADLRYRSPRQCAEALLAIAHPNHRDALQTYIT